MGDVAPQPEGVARAQLASLDADGQPHPPAHDECPDGKRVLVRLERRPRIPVALGQFVETLRARLRREAAEAHPDHLHLGLSRRSPAAAPVLA